MCCGISTWGRFWRSRPGRGWRNSWVARPARRCTVGWRRSSATSSRRSTFWKSPRRWGKIRRTMPPQFTFDRRIQFFDTDMAGIVHFANFYRFMEEAEHEMFRSLGEKIVENQLDGSVLGWPRVRASCTFEAPAYYDDSISIDIFITRVGVKSLTMSFKFRRGDQQIANGELKTVFCRFQRDGKFESIAIPARFTDKLVECPRDKNDE